ncbi:MAG: hypothetical protein RLZZ175_3114 [Bacteroidota bacterium]|jgi:hypothetical protein
MLKKLQSAIANQTPIDIYFRYEEKGETICKLVYSAFLVTNIVNNTFEGYTLSERKKNINQRILTTGCSINAVCKIV